MLRSALQPILAGYVEGKRAAEQALFAQYGSDGLALRPGMIYGPRRVDTLGITLPLGIIGAPLETLLAIPPLQASRANTTEVVTHAAQRQSRVQAVAASPWLCRASPRR